MKIRTSLGATRSGTGVQGRTLQHGFSMVELLIVLAIGAILATIAVPSLRDTLRTTRQSSAAGLLVNDLNQARGEAIKRNTRVLVCGRNADGTDCGGVTDWRVGWVVCTDATTAGTTPELPPSDGVCDASVAANPNPIVVRPALDPSLTLTAAAAAIQFNANSSQGAGGGAATLILGGDWSGAAVRTITVAGTGTITRQ
ncbi:MAG: GspH/FimT family pseudopilin [Rhodoferax sp.]|nr:GspH/FimT family pseudopilin [Rhodoferax sp.]